MKQRKGEQFMEQDIMRRLDDLEQKVNALLVFVPDQMGQRLGSKYRGWNGLSALQDYWQTDPTYLRPDGSDRPGETTNPNP